MVNLKHWRKEILLAAILLALFAGAVAIGTGPDIVTVEQYEQLLDKTEQLEAQVETLKEQVEANNDIVNRWLEVGSWSG